MDYLLILIFILLTFVVNKYRNLNYLILYAGLFLADIDGTGSKK